MKKILSLFLVSLAFSLSAQLPDAGVNFENDAFDHQQLVEIDSSDTTNCWQIAMQQKFMTGNGFMPISHVIITDSVNAYPSSDTSSFIYATYVHCNTCIWPILYFDYRIDADSADHGQLEVSLDNGATWHDAFDNTLSPGMNIFNMSTTWQANQNSYSSSTELFTGSQTGWIHFEWNLTGVELYTAQFDTILFKFTFCSDSVNTGKDGWMIDNLDCYDYMESVEEHNAADINAFPVPASDRIEIQTHSAGIISITGIDGKAVKSTQTDGSAEVNISDLPAGVYFIVFTDEAGLVSVRKILRE